jgi:hypothetical protein
MANNFTKYYDELTREDQEKARKFAEQCSQWATFPNAVFLELREEEAQRLWKAAQAKKLPAHELAQARAHELAQARAHELALAQVVHGKNGASVFVNNQTAGQGVIGTSGSVNFETPKKNRETPKKRNREEAESEPFDLVEEAVTPTPLMKRAIKRTPPKQAKTTTTPADKDVCFQSRFYNGLIQGATSMAELKGTVYEMKGFLTGRLDMVQQKCAERKFLLAQSEITIVDARVNEELMRAERDESRLQLDESRYHEECLREDVVRLREVISELRRH